MKPGKWLAGLGAFCVVVAVIWQVGKTDRLKPEVRTSEDRLKAELQTQDRLKPAQRTAEGDGLKPAQQAAQGGRLKPGQQAPESAAVGGFAEWTRAYLAAAPEEKAALETQGIEWAIERRKAMAEIIESDPERAFEVAISESVRRQLPASVAKLVEERVSTYGDYRVLAAIPLPGETLGVPPVQRSIKVDGREYKAFVYGHRLDAPSKDHLPVHGVVLDDRMAIHASAVERIEPGLAATISPPAEQFCGVAGTPLGPESLPVKVGPDIVWLCHDKHMEELRERLQDEAHRLAAAGGTGTVEGDPLESPYTEGRKRVIMFRVAFSNLPTPDITSNSLVTVHAGVNTYWQITSYGHTSLAELQRGSEIVQINLSTNYQHYDDNAGLLRDDVRAAATAQGIDLSKFDFDVTYTGSGRPAFSFGGLGFVGGPGAWVVGASRGITCHEMGHNLGFPHANFWNTSGQSAIGSGGNEEYGDPFDVMGGGAVDDGTGPGHYVSKFKWQIGWIPDADFPRLVSSSTVRIYAHDNPDSRGTRGVRFRHDNTLDYFLEFRQRYTAIPWLMSGIGLRWGSASGSSSQLIDTTPGTADGKNDSAIVIGRTFSDFGAPVHITPLGLANTYPPSIDVRVNIGAFPGNVPPTMALAASAQNTGIGTPITIAANASDANGDELAYWWDFGDGTFSTNNPATVTLTPRTAGEFKVQCVVSDMKGGTASESIIINVGAPTTFTISGRVLYRGAPLPNVLVKASATRYAYTDSDGTYTIARLTAGSYTMSALLYPYTFVKPFFSNPVGVGPDAANIDFIGVDAPQNDVSLVSTGAVWRYFDTGTDPGALWMTTGFNDAAWPSGAAQLGYGDGDEATVISYGTDPNNKYPAAYFRRTFNVPNPAALTNFVLNFVRDDGGIIYLNGVEVVRDNMPAGAVTYRTYAVANSEDATLWSIDSSLFVAGNNVLAAEVHQVNGTSSDLSFDVSLFATSLTNFANINTFYISQPADKATFSAPASIDIVAQTFSSAESYDSIEFFSDGNSLGEDPAAPFSVTWNNPPPGLYTLTAIASFSTGVRLTSPPVNISVAGPVLTQTLIASNAVWRYNDENINLGTAWITPDYSDSTWATGPAQLGFGDPGMSTTLRSGAITYYFRNTFNLPDAALVTNLTATLLRDDGAVIYINGREVTRVLMSAAAPTYLTLASTTVDGVDETIPVLLNIPPSFLHDGTNTVAVEVHQASSTSSDVRFGLELVAQLSALPTPGVRITSPAANTTSTLPNVLPLRATAVGQEISDVEFYSNGTLLGHDVTAPYSIDWQQPGVGTWTLTAIAYEAGVAAYTSAPVVVTFTAPQLSRQLVSPHALWRYNDSGTDLGTSWALRTYSDSAWSLGYARLGYGNDGESTVVSYGPDPAKRYITTYFRHAFAASNLVGINALRLSLARDDGAVVYLNGGEIYRSNIRTGVVSYTSLAQSTVNGPDETNFFTVILPSNRLIAVTNNILAVELHQDSIQSSDVGFDLALVALANTNTAEGVYLTRPAEGARITLPAAVDLAAFAFVSNDAVAAVEFYSDDAKVAEAVAFPYEANWSGAPVGSHALTAVARLASGNQITSPPVHIVVQGPPIMISQVINTLFGFGSQWKYWNNATPPPADWASATYSDAGWPEGAARLGFGLDGETTTLPSGRIAYYFRRTFNIANPALVEELIFQLRRDDGALVYINGLEYYRSNMPPGSITSTTLASTDAVGLDEQQAFITTVPASGLVTGTNVIAVEVHQSSPTSSDIGFDLHLTASGDTSPRILLSRPGNGQSFVLPANVDIEAAAWPGQSRNVNKVEFFADGNRLGEATVAPYVFQWADAPQGNHTISARMTDDFGNVLQSRVVNISVGYEVIRTNFIAAGSIWKYRDINSNEGTNFAQFSYNDSAWASGPAQLGFGDGDEATVVNGGPSGARYVTTYFRRTFQNPSAWTITNLSFRLVRDDGAVVWLNGREQYRSNMPAGAITYTTLASSTVDAGNESAVFESSFTITNLPLNNLVAVEIHQSTLTSSDISFDLELVGTGYVIPIVRPTLKIARLPEGPVRITWPASQTGWTVYSSPSPTTGWVPSGDAVGVSNNLNNVIVMPTNAATFYELRRP